MSTIKIRNLPLATNEQVKPGNFLACALDTDSGLQKLTRKLTLNQVVSGGLQDGTVPIPIASLPIATTTSLGVVQIGANLNITPEGILSANNPTSPYQLPIASTTVLGGIKVGANLTIDADGTLNAPAPSGGGGSGSGASNWSSGWVAAAGNNTSTPFNHTLNSTDVTWQIYVAEDDQGSNAITMDVQFDYLQSTIDTFGAMLSNITKTSFNLQLGASYLNSMFNHGEISFAGKYVKVVGTASSGSSGSGASNWSSGWVNTDGTTAVANGVALSFNHGLGVDNLVFEIFARDATGSTNSVRIDSQDGDSGANYGAQIQNIETNTFTIQLAQNGIIRFSNNGSTSAIDWGTQQIKVLATASSGSSGNSGASSGGGGTFYAFTSGIITNEGQHTITYPAGWTSGTPDNIIVSTRYPTGDAASTVHFQLVGFTASTVTVFAQAGSATFATHFCDVLLVKN